MRTTISRCIHCGTTYTYQLSGYPQLNEYNDEHYCPECKKAIVEALSKIPKKFDRKWRTLKEEEVTDELLSCMNRMLEEYDEANRNPNSGLFPEPIKIVACRNDDYEHTREFRVEGTMYCADFNGERMSREGGFAIRVEDEYDLTEKKYTGSHWDYTPNDHTRDRAIVVSGPGPKTFKQLTENLPSKDIDAPCGRFPYMDFPYSRPSVSEIKERMNLPTDKPNTEMKIVDYVSFLKVKK